MQFKFIVTNDRPDLLIKDYISMFKLSSTTYLQNSINVKILQLK